MCSANVYCIFILCSIILGADILDMKQNNSSLDKNTQIIILVGMIIVILICLLIIIHNCINTSKCYRSSRSSRSDYTEIA